MLCLDCHREMLNVTVGSTLPARLDTCSRCGGTWADAGEINTVSERDLAAVGIPPRDSQNIAAPEIRYCQRDDSVLERFTAESVPEDVLIFGCPTCLGKWFPNGQIIKFKRAQQVKLSYFKIWKIPIASAYTILLPILVILILAGSVLTSVVNIQHQQQTESQAASLVSEPIVLLPSSTTAIIAFTTNQAVKTSITFWESNNPTRQKQLTISSTPKTTHVIRLENLLPETIYNYQLTSGVNRSEILSFSTTY